MSKNFYTLGTYFLSAAEQLEVYGCFQFWQDVFKDMCGADKKYEA